MTDEPLSAAEAKELIAIERRQYARVVSISRKSGKKPKGPFIRSKGNNNLPDIKVLVVARLLVEGMSIRAISRVTRISKVTVGSMLKRIGPKLDVFNLSRGLVSPSDVEVDEVWTYVAKKKFSQADCSKNSHQMGANWIYLGLDRTSRMVLASHIGRRSVEDALAFMSTLRGVTSGYFTIHTDGFQPYPTAVYAAFMQRGADFRSGPLVVVRNNGEHGLLHGVEELDETRACTNHIERFNGLLRQHVSRMGRGTMAFSKSRDMLRWHLSLFLSFYNFCRVHSALQGQTPAMAAGIADRVWDLRELLLTVRDLPMADSPAQKPVDIPLEAEALTA